MSDVQGMAGGTETGYPARLDVEYPESGLSRVKTLFRIVLLIPIAILAGLVTGQIGGIGLDDSEVWPVALCSCPHC